MNTIVERLEDMSSRGRLRMIIQEDGDVILCIIPDSDSPSSMFGDTVEFCMIGSGGGGSPHTIRALRELSKVIERDNKEYPGRRGEQFGLPEQEPG